MISEIKEASTETTVEIQKGRTAQIVAGVILILLGSVLIVILEEKYQIELWKLWLAMLAGTLGVRGFDLILPPKNK